MLRWDKKRGGSKIATPLLLRRAKQKRVLPYQRLAVALSSI